MGLDASFFCSGCGKTLAQGPSEEKRYARPLAGHLHHQRGGEDVHQQVGGAVLLSATKASQETVPKHP